MIDDPWLDLTYEEALAAYEANTKLHRGNRVLLVRQVLRPAEEGMVLWVTDQATMGDHGLLLYPSGRRERT
jgi:hypothetical protein